MDIHALSLAEFYYFLQNIVCNFHFNATDIFILSQRDVGGGGRLGFFKYLILSRLYSKVVSDFVPLN